MVTYLLHHKMVFFSLYFFFTIFLSVVVNGFFLKYLKNFGTKDFKNASFVRWNHSSKPSLGGFSFYVIFLFSIVTFSFFPFGDGSIIGKHWFGLITAVTVGFISGMIDDIYNNKPLLKFVCQLLASVILIYSDFIIHISDNQTVNVIITVFWVVGIMNSINMIDNMDGVATTAAIFILLNSIVVARTQSSFTSVYLFSALGIIGALVGFLYYNWTPSKMYMGDTGSQTLGVILAALGIMVSWSFRDKVEGGIQLKQFIIPLIAYLALIIDTTTVVIRRIAGRRSPFRGGKDHITHHLAYLGLSETNIVLVLSSLSFITIVANYYIVKYFNLISINDVIFMILGIIALFLIVQYFYQKGKKINATKEQLHHQGS
jgi:UDP-GlcNAc:undecaprenyl-phosphate/decaprenyl-phosphate GlcNAc-1-phosphate transferase